MFCPICGTKAIEGADFCQKCGYKLKKDTESKQAPTEPAIVSPPKSVEKSATPMEQISEPSQDENAHRTAIPTPVDSTNIYALLSDNVNMCPAIKSVKQTKNGVILQSGIYKHFVTIASNKARIGNTLVFPLSILYGLPCGLLCYMVSSITWDFMDYGSFYLEDFYGPLLALCLLIAGITVMIHTFCGNKGKSDVAAYVREIIEPHGLASDTKKSGKPVGLVVAIILILAGVIILIFPQLEDFEFSSSRDIPSEVPNNSILPDDGNISLTQIYTSETEGFSFMYPAEWVAIDDPAAIVQFASGSTLGIRALLSVNKSDYDESAFYTTKEEFEVDIAASTDGSISDVEVTDLTDTTLCGHPARRAIWTCKNNDGIHFIVTNYYYSSNSRLYLVSFTVIEDYFSQYEPILDAIMDSYAITPVPDVSASTNETQVTSMDEAQKLVEDWLVDHPMGPMAWAGTEAAANDLPSISAEYYVLELWEAPTEFRGLVFVRKSDGYMIFHDLTDAEYDLDAWYAEQFAGGNTTSDEQTDLQTEYTTLVEDEGSWITLYQDGTFVMQVNLYVTYGTLSGTYEETDWGFTFHVKERDFSGYEGDDVEEFEMVICDYGVEYCGDTIGTIMSGSVYQ